MNVGDIKRRVRRVFGDESGTFLEDADLIDWINDGQLDLVKSTRCLEDLVILTTTPGSNFYVLPVDILAVSDVFLNHIRLEYVNFKDHGMSTDNTVNMDINVGFYTMFDGKIYFNSMSVTGAVPYQINYLRRPSLVAVDGDIPDIPVEHHTALVKYCLGRASEMAEEYNAAQMYNAQFERKLVDLHAESTTVGANSYPAVRIWDSD